MADLICEICGFKFIPLQDAKICGGPMGEGRSLHKGEEEALLLAINLGRALFATDDGKAIKAARFFNVPFIVTPKIVVELLRLQEISFKRARESLEKLAKIGRYSPEIIADALISLMEKENGKADNHKNT